MSEEELKKQFISKTDFYSSIVIVFVSLGMLALRMEEYLLWKYFLAMGGLYASVLIYHVIKRLKK